MKYPKYVLVLTQPEYRLLLHSLVCFRNKLLAQQRYPDAIDELLDKLLNYRR